MVGVVLSMKLVFGQTIISVSYQLDMQSHSPFPFPFPFPAAPSTNAFYL